MNRIDLAILIAYLVGITVFGCSFYFKKGVCGTEGFVSGERRVPVSATLLGVLAVAWIVFGQKALHPNLAIVIGTCVLFASGLGLSLLVRRDR